MYKLHASLLSLAIAAGIFLFVQPSQAAPFCVEAQGLPSECLYVDALECRKQAAQRMGICNINTAEVKIVPGIGKYCLVYSSLTASCIYNDRVSCNNDAVRSGGVCIDSTPLGEQPDPYRLDPNRRY